MIDFDIDAHVDLENKIIEENKYAFAEAMSGGMQKVWAKAKEAVSLELARQTIDDNKNNIQSTEVKALIFLVTSNVLDEMLAYTVIAHITAMCEAGLPSDDTWDSIKMRVERNMGNIDAVIEHEKASNRK